MQLATLLKTWWQAGVADEILVQVSYVIGVAEPLNIYVNTYGTSHLQISDGEIQQKVAQLFDLRPGAIERNSNSASLSIRKLPLMVILGEKIKLLPNGLCRVTTPYTKKC